jgi:hypothetical protein
LRAVVDLLAMPLKRLLDWIKGENRDHSKTWFQDRKDRKAASLKARDAGAEKLESALPDSVGAHRDNVLLALGSLFFVGGVGLVTAAWLGGVALAAAPSTTDPRLSLEIFGWVILGAGILALLIAGWIFVSFFRILPVAPPRTLIEKREFARKARQSARAEVRAKGPTPAGGE